MLPSGAITLPDTSFTIIASSDTVVNMAGNNFTFVNISATVPIVHGYQSVSPNTAYNFYDIYGHSLSYIYPSDSLEMNVSNSSDPFDYDYTIYQSP